MAKKPKSQMPTIVIGNLRPDPAYWQALGSFIESFANIELVMFGLLAVYAKVSNKQTRALFSGTRVDAAIKLIRRLIAVEDPGELQRKELEIVFAQLSAINEARNDIVHYGSMVTTEGRMTTNISRAHLAENVTWRPISTDVVNAMTEDLHKIRTHLMLHQKHGGDDETRDRLLAFDIRSYAWLYKPPQDHEMKRHKAERPGPSPGSKRDAPPRSSRT